MYSILYILLSHSIKWYIQCVFIVRLKASKTTTLGWNLSWRQWWCIVKFQRNFWLVKSNLSVSVGEMPDLRLPGTCHQASELVTYSLTRQAPTERSYWEINSRGSCVHGQVFDICTWLVFFHLVWIEDGFVHFTVTQTYSRHPEIKIDHSNFLCSIAVFIISIYPCIS